jgi:uncharacterized protein YrzB (UPF0473 family)
MVVFLRAQFFVKEVFIMSMHEHEHEHEHEHKTEVFSLIDQDGNEVFFHKLGEVEDEGNLFWVCEEVFLNDARDMIEDLGEVYIFKAEETPEGVMLEGVEYATAQKVFEKWQNSIPDIEEIFFEADTEEDGE